MEHLLLLKGRLRLEPRGWRTAGVGICNSAICFAAAVEGAIRYNGVTCSIFDLIWHGESKGSQMELWNVWGVAEKPDSVFQTSMGLRIGPAILMLLSDGNGEPRQPLIVFNRGASPFCARMMKMDGAIGSSRGSGNRRRWGEFLLGAGNSHNGSMLEQMRICSDPVRSVEHLDGFENHFHHMFICMGLGGFSGIEIKDKDIHCSLGLEI